MTQASSTALKTAGELMQEFALRTGMHDESPPRRYLWTDAFAVCNFLELARHTHDAHYISEAQCLIDQVHHTLGKHRGDDSRTGWLSGMRGERAEAHPTAGGLRIGKPLPERGPHDPYDDRAEWDRDGQYFHYLSKWMHALNQTARACGEARYNRWARELADAALKAFVYHPARGAAPRMFWKMSIDLTRPQVPAMGQHDPLDAYLTCLQLQHTADQMAAQDEQSSMHEALTELERMVLSGNWASTDALGIGGLLADAYRIAQLQQAGTAIEPKLLNAVLDAAVMGLKHYRLSNEIQFPPEYRLAFRELGLAIGLFVLGGMQRFQDNDIVNHYLPDLQEFLPLRDAIVEFWSNPVHQNVASWREHQDINEVMLATALSPGGFLEIT